MNDTLNKDDVNTLLTAVETGDVDPGAGTEQQIFSRHRRDLEKVEIKDYDFKRPERISKDQMRALQTLHETYARNFGASLSGYLRTIVEIRIARAEQMTYSEFIAGLHNPTSFSLVQAPELDGQMCLEISPLIFYPIIDRLLGGNNHELVIPQRAMTRIEIRLVQTILSRAMTALSEAWESVKKINFDYGEMESNPQIVQIVPPNEVVVVLGFEITMANRAGTMTLCIPFNVIEPLIDDLSSQSWFLAGRHRGEHQWEERISRHLSDAILEVSGVLAETTMTMAELRDLEVGDLILTEKPATQSMVMAVEGVSKFLSTIGQHKGNRALKIIRPVSGQDRV